MLPAPINPDMKYILVTGGVISGIGKGILASSFGTILKGCGLRVTSIKIDPYLNIDAGTFSPFEHGEVYVLEDGSEVDLDLGNYERFLGTTLRGDNNITTGKIYQQVIRKERKGSYLGKTVQVVPHVTECIQEWVLRVANTPRSEDNQIPDVCIIELGGVIGDIESMPFVEAFRQLRNKLKKEDFCLAHVSLVPELPLTFTSIDRKREQKSKPTQTSVRELRSLGLMPDLVFCRSSTPLNDDVRKKISDNCHVKLEEVISVHEVSNIYEVPILIEAQGIVGLFADILKLDISSDRMDSTFTAWKNMAINASKLTEEVSIVIVGKYTKLEDAYASITRSLQHAALAAGYKLKLEFVDADKLENIYACKDATATLDALSKLDKCDGVVVAGGFGKRGVEGKIEACRWCREHRKPFLGICLGLQVAVIEFARNVLNIKNADSSEFYTPEELKCSSSDEDSSSLKSDDSNESVALPTEMDYVIIDMPEHTKGDKGGTMRLGLRKTFFKSSEHKEKSVLYELYGRKDVIEERHRHRYEVNPKYVKRLEEKGLLFVGVDEEKNRMEIMELHDGAHPYYVATQYHPEYTSRPLKPSPPFYGLILASQNKLKDHLDGSKAVCNKTTTRTIHGERPY